MEVDINAFAAKLDIARRKKLVERATDGMKDENAIEFLLKTMQDHIHNKLPSRIDRSHRQDELIYMILNWEKEFQKLFHFQFQLF